jgi:hypothetical protein
MFAVKAWINLLQHLSASFLGRGKVRDPREAGLVMHPCGWPTRASAQALKRAIASLNVIVLLDTRQAPRRPLAAFSPSRPATGRRASLKAPPEGASVARLALVVGLGLFQPLP